MIAGQGSSPSGTPTKLIQFMVRRFHGIFVSIPMKRILPGLLIVSGILVVTATESFGDDAKRSLTPLQQKAKADVSATLASSLATVKERCGVDLPVTFDFENYDEAAWLLRPLGSDADLNENRRSQARGAAAGECAAVVDAVAAGCAAKSEQGNGGKPSKGQAQPPETRPKGALVTGIACLFGGYQPITPGEAHDDHVQRNMSFSNGLITLHMAPKLGNIQDNAVEVLRPMVHATYRKNGAACDKTSQCRSNACSGGTCQACGSKVACAANASCREGVCWTNVDPTKGKSRNGGCKVSSECAENLVCRLVKGLQGILTCQPPS